MSSLHGIDEVISRIWEELPVFAKEVVLDGYLEMYNSMCIVCCGDVTDNKCEDVTCPGPASKTPEDICEEAFHAMHDNLGDMDFDTDAMSLLSSFIEVWESSRNCIDKYPSEIEVRKIEIELALKPYADLVNAELTRIKGKHSDFIRDYPVDMDLVRIDKGYCRELLQIMLQLEA